MHGVIGFLTSDQYGEAGECDSSAFDRRNRSVCPWKQRILSMNDFEPQVSMFSDFGLSQALKAIYVINLVDFDGRVVLQ